MKPPLNFDFSDYASPVFNHEETLQGASVRTTPATLIESLEHLTTQEIALIETQTEKDWVASAHFAFGRWLRNNWGLWDKESALAKHFHGLDIYHADDMSGILLTCFWRHVHKVPLKVEEQVAYYQNYWRKQGVDIKAEALGATAEERK